MGDERLLDNSLGSLQISDRLILMDSATILQQRSHGLSRRDRLQILSVSSVQLQIESMREVWGIKSWLRIWVGRIDVHESTRERMIHDRHDAHVITFPAHSIDSSAMGTVARHDLEWSHVYCPETSFGS